MYAVISDVHSNLEALDAVIGDINKRSLGADIIFLGDAVGYGPEPNECISRIREVSSAMIAGNHDRGAVGLTDINRFNQYAKTAIKWTNGVLSKDNADFLRGLPLTLAIKDFFLVHSTPKRPELWNYLLYMEDAEENFGYFNEGICFLGHSHLPLIIEKTPSGRISNLGASARMSDGCRYIVNVGSVGQPRDGDPRACYVLFNDNEIEIVRVPYPVERTQEKMRRTGLPSPLIERLSVGR